MPSLLKSVNLKSQFLLPGISKSTLLTAFLSTAFYFAALYPSRNHWDTVRILELSREGDSSDQWTAIYFRFLEYLSLGGKVGFLPALVGLIGLVLAFLFFIFSFDFNARTLNSTAKIFLLSPFIGVFGMTLTHEVQSTAGTLLLIGLLTRESSKTFNGLVQSKVLVLLSSLLLSMIHTGVFIFLGFLIAKILINKRDLVFLSLTFFGLLIVALFGHHLLHVKVQGEALRYQSFLGDIKCVTQHPDANLDQNDWKILLLSGTREEWTNSSSCAYSQVYFAFPWVEKNQKDLLKLWLKITRQNPQLSLEARFQRAAIALPPLLFTAPQEAIRVNSLEPAGLNTQDDLLSWSPLFKTSNDDAYQKLRFKKLRIMEYFEVVAILPAHLLNRNSAFWGWAGLWLSVSALIMYVSGSFQLLRIGILLLPQIFTCISLLLFSPISDPRYSINVTLTSMTITVLLIPNLFKTLRKLNEKYSS